jgi:hypothetical protein
MKTENKKNPPSENQMKVIKQKPESAKKKIKPRGLAGLYKGQIHYDKNADVFNLSL